MDPGKCPNSVSGMQLGMNLKHLMVERDVKASQLSRATRVAPQTIHNWLAGQHPRNIDQVKRVADYLGVSLDHLLYGMEPKKLETFEQYRDEINAGVFEVILRRTERK